MKKTAKLLSLAVALFAGVSGTAQAEGFKLGADVVSSYVWRGTQVTTSPAIQPALSYTFKNSDIVVGAWGSYAISEHTGAVANQETDVYVTVPVGPVSVTLTDYYNQTATSRTFDFSDDSNNIVELSVAYAKDNVSLMGAMNVAGTDTDNAMYLEAGYKFYEKDGYTAKACLGAGNEAYTSDQDFTLVNTGISVSKDRYTASCIYNPDTEASSFVFMASF
uniref:Uncharacterized protein n=1 Tax=Chlorobium chlorochromatii (strain CaD3) TaxID=340177 RepID=Q3ASZ2_CHLCH